MGKENEICPGCCGLGCLWCLRPVAGRITKPENSSAYRLAEALIEFEEKLPPTIETGTRVIDPDGVERMDKSESLGGLMPGDEVEIVGLGKFVVKSVEAEND